jgi:hypothetical protein
MCTNKVICKLLSVGAFNIYGSLVEHCTGKLSFERPSGS